MISGWPHERTGGRMGRAALLGAALGACMVLACPAVAAAPLDASKPFEINADMLEIQQERRRATFAGNVAARQGDLMLRADRLIVDYAGGPKGKDGGAGGKVMDGAPEISQLEAHGRVHLVSPTETARSDWAVYDVPTRIITMGGDVVLTRGDNILQGQKLTLNLLTGESRLESTRPTASRSTAGRVRAIFNPSAAHKQPEAPGPKPDAAGKARAATKKP